jgi:hypothetical protein
MAATNDGSDKMLRAIDQHWATIGPLFSAEALALVRALLGRMTAGEEQDVWQAHNELSGLLLAVLPDDHPARTAMLAEHRGATLVGDWTETARALLAQLDLGGGRDVPIPEEVAFWATRRILESPALTEDDLRMIGHDPADTELIHLERHDGGRQWPDFQFGADGSPVPIVLTINRILDVEEDPWGVADWWLGRNAWLDGVPARLLGRVPDDVLVSAARAVDPGV